MMECLPALHICFPACADDLPVKIEVQCGRSVDSVGFHDFKRLSEEGGKGACGAGQAK